MYPTPSFLLLSILVWYMCYNERTNIDALLLMQVFQVALLVKNPPASTGDRRDRIRSISWEDPLEEVTATQSSILAHRIPWTAEPGGL